MSATSPTSPLFTPPTPLDAFASWWLQHRVIAPPAYPVTTYGGLTATVLYREGQFQVQMFAVKPGSVIPQHQHPKVDSYEVAVSGQIDFTVEDKTYPFDAAELPFGTLSPPIRVKPDYWHGGVFGPEGAVFLSIQHWVGGEPSCVGADWVGTQGQTKGECV